VLVSEAVVAVAVVACATRVRAKAAVPSLHAQETNARHAVLEQPSREVPVLTELHPQVEVEPVPAAAVRGEVTGVMARGKAPEVIIGDGEETGLFSPWGWPSLLDRDTQQR